jgi:hypothetical protein
MKSTLKLSLLLGTAVAAMNLTALAGPGPGGGWPAGFPTHVKSKEEAMDCCKPGVKVALACKDCKTVNEKDGEKDKKGIMSWFAPDSKHDCSGCGGKITVTTTGGGKGPTLSQYKHTCSKCGPDSAFTCATHKAKG